MASAKMRTHGWRHRQHPSCLHERSGVSKNTKSKLRALGRTVIRQATAVFNKGMTCQGVAPRALQRSPQRLGRGPIGHRTREIVRDQSHRHETGFLARSHQKRSNQLYPQSLAFDEALAQDNGHLLQVQPYHPVLENSENSTGVETKARNAKCIRADWSIELLPPGVYL
ncbi:uncharacterized protein B0I36DRAFT_391468 [Microdochium trichocladiopsis]|uniref:Uncharacterized protein n=1 Tax=Microdochium trichocladiopsis TaxID=1682393 RepID=A0A9P8YHY2_9PEZI|nr:uncharacterized protein B0I36DRAFT_391468 [Microdochium trichocladiopsis]KAH7040610.1 hypothetical protein B0I36DRAFT_391468 [Microdochium trichocladiopsis]